MFGEFFFYVGIGLTVSVVGGVGTLAWKQRTKILAWLALGSVNSSRDENGAAYDHNLPYLALGNLFMGRNKTLSGLEGALAPKPGSAVISQAKTIHGEGGVGKTRLAVEFTWKELKAGRCKAAYFVRGDSPEHLDAQIASLYPRLYPGHDTPQNQSDAVEAVVAALIGHTDWLLIVDNVDQIDARERLLTAYLPRLTGGRVLITSRLADWPPQVWAFALTAWDEKSAVAYLLEKTHTKRNRASNDKAAARDLAKALDYLPIALEQAAAYIANTQIGFQDYLAKLEESPAALLDRRIEGTTDHPSSVLRVWETTEQQLSPGAKAVLRLASFLAPEPIPRALFEDHPETVSAAIALLSDGDAHTGPDRLEVAEFLGELARWSMIGLEADHFTIHRLTQDLVRLRIEEDRYSALLDTALELLNDHLPEDPPPGDVRSWKLWEAMEAHVQTAIGRCASTGDEPSKLAILMNDLAVYFKARVRFGEVEPLSRRALEIDEASLGSDHPNVAIRLNNLAMLLQDTNRRGEAEPLMRRALEIDETAFGRNHPKVALRLSNLGALLKDTNRLHDAETMMRRALEIDQVSLEGDDPRVAIDLNNLAQLLADTNRLDEAEPMMRRALEITEAAFGPDHPTVAIRLNNLAMLLQDTNRLHDAETMMRRVLEIDETAFGPSHPIVAIRLNNLAQLLKSTNRLDEAEPMMRRALEIDETAFGPDHPNVARDLNNLAILLQDTHRLHDAETMMQRALEIDETSFGPDHPDVARDLNNLAILLRDTHRLHEAQSVARRSLNIFRASFGEEHPRTKTALTTLRAIEKALGKD